MDFRKRRIEIRRKIWKLFSKGLSIEEVADKLNMKNSTGELITTGVESEKEIWIRKGKPDDYVPSTSTIYRAIVNAPKGKFVHHIDLDRNNNKRDNLIVYSKKEHLDCHKQQRAFFAELMKNKVIIFDRKNQLYDLKKKTK